MAIDVPKTAWRALRLRCPNCGNGGFFETWFRLRQCHICGFNPSDSDAGYGMGALTINMVVSEILALGAVLVTAFFTWPNPPWDFLLYGGLALAVGLPFFFYPFATSIFVAVNYSLRVSETLEPVPRDHSND